MPQKIHFTVFAQAYYVEMEWGFGCPSGGIKRFGNLCHKYHIPVTWLVSPKSARCEMELFTEFHQQFGDEIALFFRFPMQNKHTNEREMAQTLSVEQYRQLIRDQKAEIQKYLPWAKIKIAGQGIRTPNLLTALQLEGFIGMFGHCVYQIGVDSITDFGMPWGSFRLRPNNAHLPAQSGQDGLVTFEWTMRDLNRSFHTAKPELWSTDPNDVERGGVCTDTNVEYWKGLYKEYERALPLNDKGIWFQFHQEAHEMTWGEICKPFTEERVIFTEKMMDQFFSWLVQQPSLNLLNATQAAELYQQESPHASLPMFIPYAWIPVPEQLDFWRQVKERIDYSGNISKHAYLPNEFLFDYLGAVNNGDPIEAMRNPPWKDSFFFFDSECQLIFDLGRAAPVAVFNYLNYEPDPEMLEMTKGGGGAPGFFLENSIPIPKIEWDAQNKEHKVAITVENTMKKEYPYGIFLWKSLYPGILEYFQQLTPSSKEISFKISPDQGIFIRINLKPQLNKILL